jgi:hypothetical protein
MFEEKIEIKLKFTVENLCRYLIYEHGVKKFLTEGRRGNATHFPQAKI